MDKLSVIDISETALHNFDHEVIEKLFLDHSTSKGEIKKNIKWCTDDYAHLGEGYQPNDQITIERITGENDKLIRFIDFSGDVNAQLYALFSINEEGQAYIRSILATKAE